MLKTIDVCFSPSSNAEGEVADAIHRPRELKIILQDVVKYDKDKAKKVCHFYYYMCFPYMESYTTPEAKRLVFTASIMLHSFDS